MWCLCLQNRVTYISQASRTCRRVLHASYLVRASTGLPSKEAKESVGSQIRGELEPGLALHGLLSFISSVLPEQLTSVGQRILCAAHAKVDRRNSIGHRWEVTVSCLTGPEVDCRVLGGHQGRHRAEDNRGNREKRVKEGSGGVLRGTEGSIGSKRRGTRAEG